MFPRCAKRGDRIAAAAHRQELRAHRKRDADVAESAELAQPLNVQLEGDLEGRAVAFTRALLQAQEELDWQLPARGSRAERVRIGVTRQGGPGRSTRERFAPVRAIGVAREL